MTGLSWSLVELGRNMFEMNKNQRMWELQEIRVIT